ncbi:YceI family protein [Helicobacter mehlei]|uniref:Polyisoprenoid-binding protein n=1 Tax=Helicobacter mehlei TaxID=2316080 RepID=A0A553ULQ8_9HELI|nr:YceI family protein [Helicobacter mehlei]TSA81125.1 polyisoprenoid-binding protein [Helicobacter mehlei]
MQKSKKIIGLSLLSWVLFNPLLAKPYQIDKAHTHVGFKVKHLQISRVMGDFKDYSAVIDFDPSKHTFNKLEAIIKVASVDTDNQNRDAHLRTDDFFKVEKYPEIHFVMEKYQKINAQNGQVEGTLSIAGVSRKVKLKAEIGGVVQQDGKEKIGFSLSGQIKRSDFKFAPQVGKAKIGDVVTLNIEVEAAQK